MSRQTELATLQVGKRYGVQYGRAGHVYIRHLTAETYIVVAAWPLHATHDEDPGSVLCGCALQGHSHAHAERSFDNLAAAAAVFEAASDAVAGRRVPTFAPSQRIGAT